MTGIITLESGDYIFRDDSGYGGIWAWRIDDDPGFGGHIQTHKWPTLPNGFITTFDIDNPPATVPYIPILN